MGLSTRGMEQTGGGVWSGSNEGVVQVGSGDWLERLHRRCGGLFTSLGCLSLFAVPLGGVQLMGLVGHHFGVGRSAGTIGSCLIVVATPAIAWWFLGVANGRHEKRGRLRELLLIGTSLWLGLVVLVAIVALIAWWRS